VYADTNTGASSIAQICATLPSDKAVSATRDLAFEAIIEHASLAESYSRSVTEAAWRGDETTLGVHLRQLRLTVIAALKSYNDIVGGAR
jgi:hypothetical protein